jgi:hypothetical protein
MRRREFIKLFGGAAAAWPLVARAQQGDRMRRIGVLMAFAESDPEGLPRLAAFREELQKLGWTEARNILIDTKWLAPLDVESRQRFAKELVALQPDLILSHASDFAATNAYHPHHFSERFRSDRQRFRRELSATGRQRYRFHQS